MQWYTWYTNSTHGSTFIAVFLVNWKEKQARNVLSTWRHMRYIPQIRQLWKKLIKDKFYQETEQNRR